jgi:hypothetical protein
MTGWGRRKNTGKKIKDRARLWWLMPVILATLETEIRRIMVPGLQGQIVHKAPSPK